MKRSITLAAFLLAAITLFSACRVSAFGNGHVELVNTLTQNAADSQTLEIRYAIGDIRLLTTTETDITVKEYATSNYTRPRHAAISQKNGTVVVQQGDCRNMNTHNMDTTIRVEIFIPQSFAGSVLLYNDIGMLVIKDNHNFTSLEAHIDVGEVQISKFAPQELDVSVEVGSIELKVPAGYSFTYDVTIELGEFESAFLEGKSGTFGDDPTATVTLSVELGSISIQR